MSAAKAKGHYVWIWLPRQTDPTLCGFVRWNGKAADFAYVRSYLANPDAIAITPDWTLDKGFQSLFPAEDDALPGVLADVAPGRWGEYVLGKVLGRKPDAFEYLLMAKADRTGALEFTAQHNDPPVTENTSMDLQVVARAVADIEAGKPVDPQLLAVLQPGPSLGGRRPKAAIQLEGDAWIAKFCSNQDRDWEQPRREAFGLAMARRVGIDVPDFRLVEVDRKPVLLVRRFDRTPDGLRQHVLSARTLMNLSDRRSLDAGSYPGIAHRLRQSGESAEVAASWFDRMVFNVAIGNTDDHALNHLFGWDGRALRLMPAFDLEPQIDAGRLRTHQLIIGEAGSAGSLDNVLSAHAEFGLSRVAAQARIRRIVEPIAGGWKHVAEELGIASRSVLQDALLPDTIRPAMAIEPGDDEIGMSL